ncbi:acylneuraminate cytidylyltransferase family protein [Planktomarina temperata]|nr:acylneuraminate cytidylyltransferase family protein [Planktomarina temperata]
MRKVIGFIPARGGSKGVPGKNLKNLHGKPLIQWTIDAAMKSGCFDQIVVSSDYGSILDVAKKCNADIDHRPDGLGEDDTETVSVVIDFLVRHDFSEDDIILLLQPTCPFRSDKQIADAIKIYDSSSAIDSVVSVCSVDGNHPFRMKRIEGGSLVNFIDQGFEDMRPRQALPKVYIRSGSIYLSSVANILASNSLVSGNVVPVVERDEFCINIDTSIDFMLAELIAEHHF